MAKKIASEHREQREWPELLPDAGIDGAAGVRELFREMVRMGFEKGLECELEEEPGCSKHDDRSKETDGSRSGYSEKTLRSSLGNADLSVPRSREDKPEPQIVKKNQTILKIKSCPCKRKA